MAAYTPTAEYGPRRPTAAVPLSSVWLAPPARERTRMDVYFAHHTDEDLRREWERDQHEKVYSRNLLGQYAVWLAVYGHTAPLARLTALKLDMSSVSVWATAMIPYAAEGDFLGIETRHGGPFVSKLEWLLAASDAIRANPIPFKISKRHNTPWFVAATAVVPRAVDGPVLAAALADRGRVLVDFLCNFPWHAGEYRARGSRKVLGQLCLMACHGSREVLTALISSQEWADTAKAIFSADAVPTFWDEAVDAAGAVGRANRVPLLLWRNYDAIITHLAAMDLPNLVHTVCCAVQLPTMSLPSVTWALVALGRATMRWREDLPELSSILGQAIVHNIYGFHPKAPNFGQRTGDRCPRKLMSMTDYAHQGYDVHYGAAGDIYIGRGRYIQRLESLAIATGHVAELRGTFSYPALLMRRATEAAGRDHRPLAISTKAFTVRCVGKQFTVPSGQRPLCERLHWACKIVVSHQEEINRRRVTSLQKSRDALTNRMVERARLGLPPLSSVAASLLRFNAALKIDLDVGRDYSRTHLLAPAEFVHDKIALLNAATLHDSVACSVGAVEANANLRRFPSLRRDDWGRGWLSPSVLAYPRSGFLRWPTAYKKAVHTMLLIHHRQGSWQTGWLGQLPSELLVLVLSMYSEGEYFINYTGAGHGRRIPPLGWPLGRY